MSSKESSDIVTLQIEDIAFEGKGVGKIGGYVYFVPKTAIGDLVEVRVINRKKNYSDAIVNRMIKPSLERIDSPCPYFDECGGCHYMHLPYKKQLDIQLAQFQRNLERIGNIKDISIDDFTGSPDKLNYRSKSIFHVSEDKVGYISINGEIIDVKNCVICTPKINMALEKIRELFEKEPETQKHVKHFSIRETRDPESIFITFAVTKSIKNKVSIFANSFKEVKKIISIHESSSPEDSTAVFSKEFKHLYGYRKIREKILDFTFEQSPQSFFQINVKQAERLLKKLLESEKEFAGKSILDLYCGVGLFSIPIAKTAKYVMGIDSSESSIYDAVENKRINETENCHFLNVRSREITKKFIKKNMKFDSVILDPPRQGADRDSLKNFKKLGADNIFYISCNPATLARDLRFLLTQGYRIKSITPVDMFPQTYHIESLTILEKK